jgi:hypothetical protein
MILFLNTILEEFALAATIGTGGTRGCSDQTMIR